MMSISLDFSIGERVRTTRGSLKAKYPSPSNDKLVVDQTVVNQTIQTDQIFNFFIRDMA